MNNNDNQNQEHNHSHGDKCSCGYGMHYGMGMGRFFVLRWILGILIIVLVFLFGMKVGEFKSSMESGYGYNGGMHNMRMMQNGGGYGGGY